MKKLQKNQLSLIACFCLVSILIPYIANANLLDSAIAIDLKRVFDNEMEKTSRSIAKGAMGEFNNSMKILFDEQINPLLTNIDFVVGKNVGIIDSALEARIGQTKNLIIKSIKAFEGATEKTINDIRDKVIKETANQIKEIEQVVFDHIMIVFEKTMDTINAVDCTQDRWLRDIKHLLSLKEKALWRWDDCYKSFGIKEFPSDVEYRTFYEIHSCKVLGTIDENTPIKRIMAVYQDLSAFALRTACIQRNTGKKMNQYFIHQWKNYEMKYEIWNRTQ